MTAARRSMTPHVAAYLREHRAQAGVLDYLTVYMPSDIRAMLDSLNSAYKLADSKAKGDAEWDAHFKEWVTYYDRQISRWGISYSQATVNEIRAREDEFRKWQERLKAKGIDTGPVRSNERQPDDGKTKTGTLLLWGGGLLLGALVVSKL